MAQGERVRVCHGLVAGVVDDDGGARGGAQVGEDVGEAEHGLGRGGEVGFPGGEGEGSEVFAEEEGVAAGDEDEGDLRVGVPLLEGGELG